MDSTNNNTDLLEASDMDFNNQDSIKTKTQQLKNDHMSNTENLFNKKTENLALGFIMSEKNENNNDINNSEEPTEKLVINDGEDLQSSNSPQEIRSNSPESIASPISDIKSGENSNSDVHKLVNENKSNMSDILSKLTESSSVLSSSSSSSCVNSSGIGSTDLSPTHDYDLSRSPSSDTYLQHHQSQMIRKREGSVASQGSVASSSKFLDNKDGLGFPLGSTAASINGTCNKKSRKEVIPQRKRRDFIPAELKDESYWERRRKNNLAAKRSREKRRLNDIVLETKVLELTNINNLMKLKFDLCIKKYNIPEDEIEKLFEDNKHLLVVQESLDMSELLTNEDSLTPGFDNEFEDKNFSSTSSYLSSSSSTSSGKRKSFKEDCLNENEGLLISSIDSSTHHLTHSSLPGSKIASDSCSMSTSSSHHIGSNSSRRSNSSVDDADCDGFNDAMSENGLEIDENLDTIIESTDNAENKKEVDEMEPKKTQNFLELINTDDLNDEEEGSCSPPSKRKSFFNPTHTSSCPSKSPSPTFQQHREEQMDNVSLSPIDSYSLKNSNSTNVIKTASDTLEKLNASYYDANKIAFMDLDKTKCQQEIKTDPPQMKAQYPLLYNQLCKASAGSCENTSKKAQSKQNQHTEITQSAVHSLEKQNQMLLNHIINNNNGAGLTPNNNPLMKSILSEISLRNEFTKQQTNSLSSSNGGSNISISSLLKQSETSLTGNTDILTKILSSSMSSSNSNGQVKTSPNALLERLGSLLKSPSIQSKKEQPICASNNQANALMEKYKNLINKTNSNTQHTIQQKQIQQQPQVKNSLSSNHSNRTSAINGQQKTTTNNQKTPTTSFTSSNKNTVNSLLQSFQTVQPADQHPSKPKNQASSSRKRHLNQLENNDQSYISSDHLLSNNADLLAYAKQQQQQQPSNENLNELVAMLLATQQNAHSFNNHNVRQQATGNRSNTHSNMSNSKNSNTAKNQTYNQLLLMHQTQKLQQQRQNELKSSQAHELTQLTSQDQLAQLQASQYYYQQQAKFNMANGEINNPNNNNNNAGGDNMPLKLRFKMLQLKTEKVN